MAIEYLGLSEINGPLVVLEGVKNASYEEIVSFRMDDGTEKLGRIIEIYEDKAVIQVFEGTDNMSLGNTHTRLSGHPMEIGLSPEILGRTFNGIGQPIDGLGEITPEVSLNIRFSPETVFHMISWLHRSCVRHLWALILMRISPLCLLQWVLSMMLQSFSAEPLRRAVLPITLLCS